MIALRCVAGVVLFVLVVAVLRLSVPADDGGRIDGATTKPAPGSSAAGTDRAGGGRAVAPERAVSGDPRRRDDAVSGLVAEPVILRGTVELLGLGCPARVGSVRALRADGKRCRSIAVVAVDGDGSFELDLTDLAPLSDGPESARLSLRTEVPGFAPRDLVLAGSEPPRRPLRLLTGERVLLPRVVPVDRETGEPVELARIGRVRPTGEVVSDDIHPVTSWTDASRWRVSTCEGSIAYALPPLAPGEVAVLDAPGYTPTEWMPPEPRPEYAVSVALRRCYGVAVTCRDAEGRPLPYARLVLEREVSVFRTAKVHGVLTRSPFLSVDHRTTDEAGDAVFEGLVWGVSYAVSVVSEGAPVDGVAYCSDRLPIGAPGAYELGAYPGGSIEAEVEGLGPDAVLVVHSPRGTVRVARASGEGRAVVQGLPHGRYRCEVGCASARPRTTRIAASSSRAASELERKLVSYPIDVREGRAVRARWSGDTNPLVCSFGVELRSSGSCRVPFSPQVDLFDAEMSHVARLRPEGGVHEVHAIDGGEAIVCVTEVGSAAPRAARRLLIAGVSPREVVELREPGSLTIRRASLGPSLALLLTHEESGYRWSVRLSARDLTKTCVVGPGRYTVERVGARRDTGDVVGGAVITSGGDQSVEIPSDDHSE